MRRMWKQRPGLLVTVVLAFGVALGASAIATGTVAEIAKKINGSKLKAESVAGSKLKPKTVTSDRIADGAVDITKLNTGSVDTRYARRFFARVNYTTATPSIAASSGGITGAGESFMGAPNIVFPQDMTSCAITATAVSGGGTGIIRQSTLSAGATVTLAIVDNGGTDVRLNFNVIAEC